MDNEADDNTKVYAPPAPRPQLYARGGGVMPIIPTTFDDVYRIANATVKAGMAPRGIDTPEKATIIIMHGLEVGLAPMVALQSIALINGKPALYGDGALGVVRASGLLEKFSERLQVSDLNVMASCTVKRRGEAALTRTFSKDDAVKANLWDKRGRSGEPTPWITYPNRMLAMRARAFALRDAFADVLRGLGIREEMEDVVPDLDLVPPPPPPPAAPRMTPLEAAIAKAKDANRHIETDAEGMVVWDENVERPATAEDVRS
jgi:hypothetical protein